jgi:hypothetical protein
MKVRENELDANGNENVEEEKEVMNENQELSQW